MISGRFHQAGAPAGSDRRCRPLPGPARRAAPQATAIAPRRPAPRLRARLRRDRSRRARRLRPPDRLARSRPTPAAASSCRVAQYGLAAGKFDQSGNPMPGAHRRIGPLEQQRPRTPRPVRRCARSATTRARSASTALRPPDAMPGRARRGTRSLRGRRRARTGSSETMRADRERRRLCRALDDVVRNGADRTELLRDDQVGHETLEQRRRRGDRGSTLRVRRRARAGRLRPDRSDPAPEKRQLRQAQRLPAG